MRIALITYFAVTNIGDKILTDTLRWFMCQKGIKVKVVDVQGRYAYRFSGLIGKLERMIVRWFKIGKSLDEKSLERFYRVRLKNCDSVVFGGGQLIDPSDIVVCRAIKVVCSIAAKMNVPVYFNAIGVKISPCVNDGYADLKIALSSRNIHTITVRENVDWFVKNYNPNSRHGVSWVCDTAVWCREAYGLPIHNSVRKTSYIVGVNVIYPEAFLSKGVNKQYVVGVYRRIINAIMKCNRNVLLFTNGVQRDMQMLYEIEEGLALKPQIAKPRNQTGKSFVSMINSFDFIISSRLHTSIVSFSLQIPTVALSWDEKIDYFYRSIGEGDGCFDIKDSAVVEKIMLVLAEEVKGHGASRHMKGDRYDEYRASVLNGIPVLLND